MSNTPVRTTRSQQGFTLIELVFAMAAFSIMLTVAVSGLLNAMFIYNQSNVSRDNQQQARTIMDTIGRDIRGSQMASVNALNTQLCLIGTPDGDIIYSVSAKRLRRQSAKSDCSGPLAGSTPQILTTPGIVVVDPTDSTATGFRAYSYTQPAGFAAATQQQTIRVTLNLGRNVSATSSPRARQFSSQFQLQSTYLVRGSGG